jgi:hypothetical protein
MLAVLVLSSCGKSEICDCAETGLSMMKEAKEVKEEMNIKNQKKKMGL